MSTIVRIGAVTLFVVLSAWGCSGPTFAPTQQPTHTPSTSISIPPKKTFPPLSGPSRTFVFDHELKYHVSYYTQTSRFVLYDNGAFVLQYPAINVLGGGYAGGYTESDGIISFDFGAGSGADSGGATGTRDGNMLTVHYNVMMQMSDFEDGVYALMP